MQAVFLPVPVAVWCLFHFRQRSIRLVLLWGLVGVSLFVVGWPWLWFDPVPRLIQYFARSTDRTPLYTFYLGTRVVDKSVVWHYPFVLFATTIPVGLILAGLVGAWGKRRDARIQLMLACSLFPLVAFAIPGIAVYDGARLFLVSCPMWAILCGAAAKTVMDGSSREPTESLAESGRLRQCVLVCVLLFFAAQGIGVVRSNPLGLSYYSALCGGPVGAERLGLEPTYWGDCLTRSLWERIPRNATVYVAPVLHPRQLPAIEEQCPMIRERNIHLRVFHYDLNRENGLLLLLHRKADLPPWLQSPLPQEQLVHRVEYDGVTLARLIRASAPVPEIQR